MTYTPGPWRAIGTFIGTDELDPQTLAYCDDHRNQRLRPKAEHEANASECWSNPVYACFCVWGAMTECPEVPEVTV